MIQLKNDENEDSMPSFGDVVVLEAHEMNQVGASALGEMLQVKVRRTSPEVVEVFDETFSAFWTFERSFALSTKCESVFSRESHPLLRTSASYLPLATEVLC